jgi:hypothetical protein
MTHTRLEQLRGIVHTNGAHKNNNNNNTMPVFIGPNKITQKHRRRKANLAQEKIKTHVSSKCISMSERRKYNNIGML